jgi:hypothetical protein
MMGGIASKRNTETCDATIQMRADAIFALTLIERHVKQLRGLLGDNWKSEPDLYRLTTLWGALP